MKLKFRRDQLRELFQKSQEGKTPPMYELYETIDAEVEADTAFMAIALNEERRKGYQQGYEYGRREQRYECKKCCCRCC
jgi:hypothetical protein